MTKPIFLVGLQSSATHEDINDAAISLKKLDKDYYVIVHIGKTEHIEFQCFFEKDFDEIKYEEVKQIVRDSLKHAP
jgi:hypothetical protein